MHQLTRGMHHPQEISRRDFLAKTIATGAALAWSGPAARSAPGAAAASPIVVFSKIYQELKLDFEQAAATTTQAGLDGVDCPVRDGGEILPENAAEQLPRYAEILHQRGLQIPLLTTGITKVSSPHAESILRTARRLGIRYYRFGFITRDAALSQQQITEIRAQLKDLAALNKEVGICVLLQNHSPSGKTHYFGGDLTEMEQAVEGFDPEQIGVAFDIGHALVVHGDQWRQHFDALRPHFKIAYVKDVTRAGNWVPFGQGDIAGTGYFKLLREMKYRAPISLHIEFEWQERGKPKSRERLAQVLKESAGTLRGWLGA